MSQPALPNRHLFSSSRTQLIVTAEKLSLFRIYKAQKRGGGCGGHSRAGTMGCAAGQGCCGSCPHPSRQQRVQGSLLLCGARAHGRMGSMAGWALVSPTAPRTTVIPASTNLVTSNTSLGHSWAALRQSLEQEPAQESFHTCAS